ICLKASCARRKQQESQALPQRLRFRQRAESEEMSTFWKRELKSITNDQTLPSRNPGEFRYGDRNHQVTMCQFVSMIVKARCAFRKQQQIKALRQLLRFSERPESHKKSPNEAPAKRREPFPTSFGAFKAKADQALPSVHEAALAGGGAHRNDNAAAELRRAENRLARAQERALRPELTGHIAGRGYQRVQVVHAPKRVHQAGV